jgi:hypothetical protein
MRRMMRQDDISRLRADLARAVENGWRGVAIVARGGVIEAVPSAYLSDVSFDRSNLQVVLQFDDLKDVELFSHWEDLYISQFVGEYMGQGRGGE